MKVVVAPNAFKGSLTALEAADAIARGARAGGAEAIVVPVADGGEGTLDALVAASGGTVMGVICRGPMGIPVRAHLGRLEDGTGVVEMAQASGLVLVPETERDPMRATSHGTGELVKGALARRPPRIIVALGGSATVDGGMGIARALGVRFFDDAGKELAPGGGSMAELARIDVSGLDARLGSTELLVACDVNAPLTGPEGAAYRYAPQKGANPKQVEDLEAGLRRLAEVIGEQLEVDVDAVPGAGAAGGAGAMLLALGGKLRGGAGLVLELAGLKGKLDGADLVITGEGRVDAQTLAGKAPGAVAEMASRAKVPCIAIVGESDLDGDGPFDEVLSLVRLYDGDRAKAMRAAGEGLASLAREAVRGRSVR